VEELDVAGLSFDEGADPKAMVRTDDQISLPVAGDATAGIIQFRRPAPPPLPANSDQSTPSSAPARISATEERIWQLRHQFTSYLALAEALQAPLLTCDAKARHRRPQLRDPHLPKTR